MSHKTWVRWIPNSLTLLRAALAVVFPFLPREFWLGVFVFAAATEFLDGYLARRLNIVSRFGQVLDPIADKAFLFSVAATLLYLGVLTPPVLLLVGIRDIFVILCVAVLWVRGKRSLIKDLKARWPGKLTTALQFVFLVCLLGIKTAPPWLVGLTALSGAWAAFDYWQAYRGLGKQGDDEANRDADEAGTQQ